MVPGGPLTGLRLVDFGSGDGRIVAWAAKKGMHATGYELNPLGSQGTKGSTDGRNNLGDFTDILKIRLFVDFVLLVVAWRYLFLGGRGFPPC